MWKYLDEKAVVGSWYSFSMKTIIEKIYLLFTFVQLYVS